MAEDFKLPDLGEGVHEGQVLRLLVAEGDTVVEDQVLMEVETDKAAVEIPSPHGGRIDRLHVSENQLVNVGDVMVTFGDTGSAPAAPRVAAVAAVGATPTNSKSPMSASVSARRKPASPAVRKLARTMKVDLEAINGSGPGGRIVRSDVEQAAAAGPAATAPPATAQVPVAATFAPAPPPPAAAPGVVPAGVDGKDDFGATVRVPAGLTRKHIAEVMTQAIRTIPHVTDCDDADVTALNELRRGYNAGGPPEAKLGMLPFVLRAVALALVRHPLFGASYDLDKHEVVYRRYVNIAVGVQTERGLVAPVIHQADQRSVRELSQELARLVDAARTGRLRREDNAGATYTISNAGAMGGSRYSTPIITPPQVAVLAVGVSRLQPWCVDGAIEPRLIMPLSHSMDHRVIDGALEIAFLKDIIAMLENPGRMLI